MREIDEQFLGDVFVGMLEDGTIDPSTGKLRDVRPDLGDRDNDTVDFAVVPDSETHPTPLPPSRPRFSPRLHKLIVAALLLIGFAWLLSIFFAHFDRGGPDRESPQSSVISKGIGPLFAAAKAVVIQVHGVNDKELGVARSDDKKLILTVGTDRDGDLVFHVTAKEKLSSGPLLQYKIVFSGSFGRKEIVLVRGYRVLRPVQEGGWAAQRFFRTSDLRKRFEENGVAFSLANLSRTRVQVDALDYSLLRCEHREAIRSEQLWDQESGESAEDWEKILDVIPRARVDTSARSEKDPTIPNRHGEQNGTPRGQPESERESR